MKLKLDKNKFEVRRKKGWTHTSYDLYYDNELVDCFDQDYEAKEYIDYCLNADVTLKLSKKTLEKLVKVDGNSLSTPVQDWDQYDWYSTKKEPMIPCDCFTKSEDCGKICNNYCTTFNELTNDEYEFDCDRDSDYFNELQLVIESRFRNHMIRLREVLNRLKSKKKGT